MEPRGFVAQSLRLGCKCQALALLGTAPAVRAEICRSVAHAHKQLGSGIELHRRAVLEADVELGMRRATGFGDGASSLRDRISRLADLNPQSLDLRLVPELSVGDRGGD